MPPKPDAEQLFKWYWIEGWGTRQIAAALGVSQPWARKILKEHGIQLRTYKENKMPTPKGGTLSRAHAQKISKALKGNDSWRDPETGQHRNWQRVEVQCSACGKPILRKRCHMHYKRHFCDQTCFGKWRAENIKGDAHPSYRKKEIGCKQCGFRFLAPPNRTKRKHGAFCSRECHDDWRRENLRGPMLYNWLGGYEPYYGESWATAKRKARERDKHTCGECGKTRDQLGRNLDVHHIVPFRTFGPTRHREANDLSNLVCYCNKCHKIVEERHRKR